IILPIFLISEKMKAISSEYLDERVTTQNSGDEIEKLAVSFNSLLDRLQESFRRERQFIGDVAHELKTPLSTIKGEIELTLSKNRSSGEYQKALSETLIDTNRLSTTVKNILDLAWIGAEKPNLENNSVNLSAVLTELTDVAVKLASHKHITLKSRIEDDVFVAGSEDKLGRAFLNLIDNAIKYTPKDKTVSISLRKKKNNALIRIQDTGIGISEDELPHIFERFYRGSRTAKTLGSGLGLAIAQGIINAYHGEVNLTSKVGIGTTVTIALPLHQLTRTMSSQLNSKRNLSLTSF
ncbi:MAG: ATP-binding protein, partial [Patescibacteria group bacterium]